MRTIMMRLGGFSMLLCFVVAGDGSAQQLPDVVGVRPGMPAREAFAALQAKYP
jgi:hypothetical protein